MSQQFKFGEDFSCYSWKLQTKESEELFTFATVATFIIKQISTLYLSILMDAFCLQG